VPPTPHGYSIRPAREDELSLLPGIESRAARLFEGQGLPDSVLAEQTGLSELRKACADGRLFVAAAPDGSPAGFALAGELEGCAHLEEVDVDPAHGQRGLGTGLVEVVCQWARGRGLPAVTLTTFRDVPWNSPFYARLGFEEIPALEMTPGLIDILADEAARGLETARRVAMRRRLESG